jgi:hypothetical protein
MGKHADSIDRAVLVRFRRAGAGAVFSSRDFLDLGSRAAVDQALSRNCRGGVVRRVATGLYELPRISPRLGPLPTPQDDLVRTLARRDAIRIQRSGAHAAHALGLTDQVPLKDVYLTDGRPRKLNIGKAQIVFKHAAQRTMATAGRASGDVIQALRWLGADHVDDAVVSKLRAVLSDKAKAQILKDLRFAPDWMTPVLSRIAGEGDS